MDSTFIWSFTDDPHDHSYGKCTKGGIKLETDTSHRVSERVIVEQEPTSSEMKQEQKIHSEMAEVKLETAWSMITATEMKQESIEFDVEKTEVLEADLKTGRFCKISKLISFLNLLPPCSDFLAHRLTN